jgi:hypothetical protein
VWTAGFGGAAAGIFGFTGSYGFLFYLVFATVVSILLAVRCQFSPKKYFYEGYKSIFVDHVLGEMRVRVERRAADVGADCTKCEYIRIPPLADCNGLKSGTKFCQSMSSARLSFESWASKTTKDRGSFGPIALPGVS